MEMARQKIPLNCYIDPDVWERLDAYVRAQPYGATKTAIVEFLLTQFLDEEDVKSRKLKKT